MPIGPSHSRGGGGSRSSGGFGSSGGTHSHGGSFGGFGGGQHIHIPRVPIRLNLFGSRIVVSTGRQSAIVAIVVFLVFAIFGCFVTSTMKQNLNSEISDYKAYISQCELDAVWYENAKQKAIAGTDQDFFITYATDYDYYYDRDMAVVMNNVKFYYLIYEYQIPIDSNNDGVIDYYQKQEGETYSTFSSSQAIQWDRKIFVGKDGGSWASMNYNYSLSTNQEYLFQKQELAESESTLKTINAVFIGLILISVAIVVVLVIVIVKTIKKGKLEFEKEQQKKAAEVAEAQAKADEARRRASQISRVCIYCGCDVPDGAEKCPSCGSSDFK